MAEGLPLAQDVEDVVVLQQLDGPAADDVQEVRRLAGCPDDDGLLREELDPNAPPDALELLGGQRVEWRVLAQERGNVHRGSIHPSQFRPPVGRSDRDPGAGRGRFDRPAGTNRPRPPWRLWPQQGLSAGPRSR
jgi:hypothetical protein